MGSTPITRSIVLINIQDQNLVLGTVVKDSSEELKLQLDYLAEDILKDSEGYIGVRWTKKDLQHMLSLLELTEERLKDERERKSTETGR